MAAGEIKIRDLRIQDLIKTYEQTYANIVKTIVDETEAGKIRKAKTLATIKAQLTDLGVDVNKWVSSEIPQYYLDGANQAIQQLKAAGVELSGPKGLVPINKEAIATLVDSTNQSFASGLTAIARNAQTVVNSAVKQQISFTIAEGKLTGEARKTVAAGVVKNLEDNGIAALTDRAGRDWSFDRYADMLVRTKAVEARNAGLTDKMLQNGYDLVQVSDHGSTHAECAAWEGQILSITGNTPGYPTTDEAEADGLLHPNCEHAYNTIDPDLAALTEAYDNPYNYDDEDSPAASTDSFRRSTGTGKATTQPIYHASGGNVLPADNNMVGNGFYVSRGAATANTIAGDAGNVVSSTITVKPSEILQIKDQQQYNAFVTQSLQFQPGDAQAAMPAFAASLGYKAIEISPDFDPLGGINIIDKSILAANATAGKRPYDALQSQIEDALNAGKTATAKKLAQGLPEDLRSGMGFDVTHTSRHLEIDPKTGKVTIKS